MATPWYRCWLSKKCRRAARCCLMLGGDERAAVLVDEVMLDVVADEERRHLAQLQPADPAPAEEPIHGALVRLPGVGVADLRLEEVGVGVLGAGAGLADDGGRGDLAAEPLEVGVDDQLVPVAARPGDGRQHLDLVTRSRPWTTPLPRFVDAG